MDCTLGLNPWVMAPPKSSDLFLDANYNFKTAVRGTEINLGPSAYALERHVQNLAVINGVFMGPTDLGHPASQNYVTTSKGSPNVPHFIAEIAEFFRKTSNEKQETILFNADLKTFDLHDLTRLPLQRLKQIALEKNKSIQSLPKISNDTSILGRTQDRLRSQNTSRENFVSAVKCMLFRL